MPPQATPDASGAGVSFWAERMAEIHSPFRYGDKIEIPPPDDVGVAALDECGHYLDDLDAIAGESLADLLLDAADDAGDLAATVVDDLLDHFRLLRTPEIGWRNTVERINVYGSAIEHDLWLIPARWDLYDYFRGDCPGGWDHLFRQVSRLPMGSHFRAALADDDELARRIMEVEGPLHKRKKGSGRPPLAGFDLATSYLHRIDNRLRWVGWAVFAAQAGKKRSSPPKDAKGPETADERVDFLDFLREHDDVVSQVLVRKGGSAKNGRAVLGPGGETVERPVPGEASRKGVLLPRAMGDDDTGDTDTPPETADPRSDAHGPGNRAPRGPAAIGDGSSAEGGPE